MVFSKGREVSFSVLTDSISSAKEFYSRSIENNKTKVIQEL